MKEFHFTVNGVPRKVSAHPASTLLDILRENLGLTASKECCGKGECGSCSIILNGDVVCSCLVLAGQIDNGQITTCEGIGHTAEMDPIQEVFVSEGATQCGYCTPGFIVSARAYLDQIEKIPTIEDIKTALGGNLCRCTGYTKIIRAVETAAINKLKTSLPVQ